MNRRGFLSTMLALGAAPAVVRATSLMPVRTRPILVTGTIGSIEGFRIITPDFNVWSAELAKPFYKATVLGSAARKEYPAVRFIHVQDFADLTDLLK